MSDNHLGKAMLNGEPSIDGAALSAEVLRRDRRRLWGLAILCVLAWMLAVLLPWSTLMPMLAKVAEHVSANEASTNQDHAQESLLMLQAIKKGTIATFLGSAISMFIAATSTVAFILLSRQSTIRQVGAQLSALSEQIRQLPKSSK